MAISPIEQGSGSVPEARFPTPHARFQFNTFNHQQNGALTFARLSFNLLAQSTALPTLIVPIESRPSK